MKRWLPKSTEFRTVYADRFKSCPDNPSDNKYSKNEPQKQVRCFQMASYSRIRCLLDRVVLLHQKFHNYTIGGGFSKDEISSPLARLTCNIV